MLIALTLATLAVALVRAHIAAPPPPSPPAPPPARDSLAGSLFAYDPARPLALRDSLVATQDGVAVHALSFASPRGGRATGLLYVPHAAPGERLAGIVYGHGTGGGARTQGPKAVYLARHGAVVVVLDAPFVRRGGPALSFTPADSAELAQLVVDQRRAVDLLLARADVDPARLAYVGHSYGGMVGALLSGAEPRLRTFVLSAADAGPVAHMQSGAVRPPEYATLAAATRARWSAALAPFDVRRLVGRAAGAPILFQHGRRDDTVPPENAARVHAAVATPHQVRWYDAGHRLPPQGYVDQLAWLARWVGMAPVTPADAAGPAFPARAPGMLPEERGTRRREMIEREQGATERQEGDMEVCALLVAPGEPARRVEVRECALHRALHHPAVASEAGTRGDARPHSFGDYRRRRNERTCPRATRHLGRGSESSRRGLDARQIA